MQKIKVKDIGPEGSEITDRIAVKTFAFDDNDYIKFIKPVEVHAILRRADDAIIGDIDIKARFSTFCYRSLEKVERDWEQNFTLEFPIDRTTEFIDVEDDIRQEVILRLPLRVLSDAELEKEEKGREDIKVIDDLQQPQGETYQPFAGLKDIEGIIKKKNK